MSFLESLHPLFRTPGEDEPNIAYFIARLGGEGRRWAEEYTGAKNVELMSGTHRALQALRARRIEEGGREVRRVEVLYRRAAGSASREVHHVLGRWYYGLLAYYFYRTGEHIAAEEALDQGHEEVRQAIERARFLLPYAMECYGFWLHRVRVSRNQRRWPEMWERVEIVREIALGTRPCCVLSDGTGVGVAAVQAFYTGFEALTAKEARALAPVIAPEGRSRQLRSFLSEIYALPGFVIPYTPAS